jgi:hypothetical protein
MMHPEEQVDAIRAMKAISRVFYSQATELGNHPFIEFCGLMNEYIKIAENARKAGIDFTDATAHQGQPLPIEKYEAAYLAEKFDCIFGPTFRANPIAWSIFKKKMEEGKRSNSFIQTVRESQA